MPCDTPPPPLPIEDVGAEDEVMEPDEYFEIVDMDQFDEMPVDDALITFVAHTDAVFCCNFDRTGHYIATGGQDEKAYVWNVLDKSIKFACTGHEDSVISVGFSSDSKYVSTADMKGLIQVWNVEDGSVAWSFDTYELTWSDWLRGQNVLLAGSIDGNCWMWDIPSGNTNIFEHPGSSCVMGCISKNDERLVTGYNDGAIKLWDIKNNVLLKSLVGQGSNGHEKTITALKYSVDGSYILSGCEDGSAKVIKAADLKVLWTLDGCSNEHEHASVESVGFSYNMTSIVVGTNCGCLTVWDLQSKTKRIGMELESSVIKIICDEFVPIVYAALGNGLLSAYDIRTGSNVRNWEGHKEAIFDLAISSDRSLFLTTSEDHTCKLFERGIL